jgi:serine/threonine protein kinase
MGRIDVAHRREGGFERLYALKRLHEQLADDKDFVAMLLDEARIAGTIRHANVVSVLDVGSDEEGLYLVMELIEGHSLHHLIEHAAAHGLLPLQVGLRILRQVAWGLHAAHETRDARGESLHVVHRDVSPQNVLVGYDGVARITDFGIAKALGASIHTQAGMVKGKIRYMAPEALTFGSIDRRADLFALGVVAFEVITGRRPHDGTPAEIAHEIISGETPDLGEDCPELPSELVELVFRLLARDPARRPATAAEVAAVFEAVLADEVSREGVVEVADYMSAHFAADRDDASRRIHEATLAAATDRETVSFRPPRAEPIRSRRRWRASAAAIAVLLGLGGALAWVADRAADAAIAVATTSEDATARDDARPGEASSPSVLTPPAELTTAASEPSPIAADPSTRLDRARGTRGPPRSRPRSSRSEPEPRVGAWSWHHGSE